MPTLLLAEHDNKSLKDATNKALTAAKGLGGEIVGVAFQRDHQRWFYEFRLVMPDGGIGRVLVDAKSGDTINRETR